MKIKGILEMTGKVAGNTAALAGVVVAEGAKTVIDGVKQTKATLEDSWQKASEVNRIAKYCEEIKEKINNQQKQYEKDYNKEIQQYATLCRQSLELAGVIYKYQKYLQKSSSEMTFNRDRIQTASLNNTVDFDGVNIVANAFIQGAATGTATGAGVAGLAALFGTASTGTAISSLSGAAFTNALLASLGGGAIAAGGAGMIGGMVVLGSLVTVPMMVVGGSIAIKKVNEQYTEAKRIEMEANETEKACQEIFEQYDKTIGFIRQLNADIKLFNKIFASSVGQLGVVANSTRAELVAKNDELLAFGIKIIDDFFTISLVDENGQPLFYDGLIEQMEDDILKYSNEFAFYQQVMTREERTIAHQIEGIPLADFAEEVERVRTLTAELEAATAIIKELEENIRVAEQSKAEEIVKAANDLLQTKMPKSYDIYLQRTKDKYPLFEDERICEFIANAEFHYDLYSSVKCSDYSSVGVEYSKAIELIIKQMAVTGILRTDALTGKGKQSGRLTIKQLYFTFIEPNKNILGSDLTSNMENFANRRNNAAHKNITDLEDMKAFKSLVMKKKKGAIIPTLYRKIKNHKNKL